MLYTLDKTVVLCAITRLLDAEGCRCSNLEMDEFQRMYDVLTGRKAHLIQSVTLSDWEMDYLEKYLEEV